MKHLLGARVLVVLLALLLPLQGMAGLRAATCCAASERAAPDAMHATEHAARTHGHSYAIDEGKASGQHDHVTGTCSTDVLSCCQVSAVPGNACMAAIPPAGMESVPSATLPALTDHPRSGPDRPPRPFPA